MARTQAAAAVLEPARTFAALAIETWSIDRPIPYPKNARKWSAKAIEKLAASIREFGWRQPIVVDKDGVIIIGHLRLAAARYLDLKEVPIHVARDLTPAQVRALRIADNRTHEESEWDSAMLGRELINLKVSDYLLEFTGFEEDEIVASVFGSQKRGAKKNKGSAGPMVSDVFEILVTCDSEAQQAQLLDRFGSEGLKCRALIS